MEKEKLVFIVDDENIILSLVEYVIGNQPGISLQTFSTVDACLAALSMKPDLVVTDHHFGNVGDKKVTGLNLLQAIRKLSADIPVLVLSSHDDPLLKEHYKQEGATEYLTKNDYFVNDLEDAIKKYLHLL